jgi:hypothetical protein
MYEKGMSNFGSEKSLTHNYAFAKPRTTKRLQYKILYGTVLTLEEGNIIPGAREGTPVEHLLR